jgi:lipoprotein Spr
MNTLKYSYLLILLVLTSVTTIAQRVNKPTTTYIILPSNLATSPIIKNGLEVKPSSLISNKISQPVTKTLEQTASKTEQVNVDNKEETRFVKRVTTEKSTSEKVLDWMKDKYSCMLNVMPNQVNNKMLYSFIEEWYGVRYRMGGMNKSGIDCSAFVQKLYSNVFGSDIVRTACMQFKASNFIKNITDLKEGDLVFFKIGTSRISHVGVYLQNNCFVHSCSSRGVMISKLTDNYWTKYFAGGGRIKQD